ncbi:MAG TPA: hypothetical protein VK009_09015 [Chloroflexota bacterium]|nr:hypothetical protein [Chloroflexota bacterium]
MNRLFWLIIGMALGALGYRYVREQGSQIPELETLGEHGKRLTERGKQFAESGKQFADSGRQLVEEGRALAQTAANAAQTRGQQLLDTVKSQAERFQGSDAAEAAQRLREDVREEDQPGGAS